MTERHTITDPPVDWITRGSDADLTAWAGLMQANIDDPSITKVQRKNCELILEMIEEEQLMRRIKRIKAVFGE